MVWSLKLSHYIYRLKNLIPLPQLLWSFVHAFNTQSPFIFLHPLPKDHLPIRLESERMNIKVHNPIFENPLPSPHKSPIMEVEVEERKNAGVLKGYGKPTPEIESACTLRVDLLYSTIVLPLLVRASQSLGAMDQSNHSSRSYCSFIPPPPLLHLHPLLSTTSKQPTPPKPPRSNTPYPSLRYAIHIHILVPRSNL